MQRKENNHRLIRIFLLVVLVSAFSMFGTGVKLAPIQSSPEQAQAAVLSKAKTKKNKHKKSSSKVSLLLNVQGKEKGADAVAVSISGKTKKDKDIDKQQNVVIGSETKLKVGPGTYKVSIASDDVHDDENAYQSNEVEFKYDGKRETLIVVQISIDTSATEQKKAEKAAAEEAARQAEAQRQAEEQARQQQEAEAAAAAQAQAQQQAQAQAQTQQNSQTVYITRTGNKYHKSGCRYLRQSSIAISLSDAQAQGYTACSVCGG